MTSKPVQANLLDKINRPKLQAARRMRVMPRPGSMDLFIKPSRFGDSLFYPDGRKEKAQ